MEKLTLEKVNNFIGAAITATPMKGVFNKGNAAGLYENLILGTDKEPLDVTGANLMVSVSKLMMFFQMNLEWVENEMLLIIPSEIYPVLDTSSYVKLRNLPRDADTELSSTLSGFRVYIKAKPPCTETGKPYIVAGRFLQPESYVLTDRQCATSVWSIH